MEKIRLQKFIADVGIMSRRAAEDEIERIKKEAVEEYIKQRDKETDGKEE